MRCSPSLVAVAVACAPPAAVEPWCDSGERPVFTDGDLVVPLEGRLLVNRDRNGRATLDVYPGASFPLASIGAELRVGPHSPVYVALFDADGLVAGSYVEPDGPSREDGWQTAHTDLFSVLPDEEMELRLAFGDFGSGSLFPELAAWLNGYVLDRVTVAVKNHVDELP